MQWVCFLHVIQLNWGKQVPKSTMMSFHNLSIYSIKFSKIGQSKKTLFTSWVKTCKICLLSALLRFLFDELPFSPTICLEELFIHGLYIDSKNHRGQTSPIMRWAWIGVEMQFTCDGVLVDNHLKVICTIFDIGAQKDSNIFQTLTVLLFFHLSQKKERGSPLYDPEAYLACCSLLSRGTLFNIPRNTL